METNGAGAAAFSTLGLPLASSRSTRHMAPTTSNPNSRAASIACTVEAPVVQTSSTITTRAPFSRKPSMRCPVPCCFSALRTRKPLQFAAHHRHRHHDGIGSHGEAADGLRLPSPLPDFVEKNFAGQARALGVKSRGAAVDVVVAGAAGRQLELAQPERLVRRAGAANPGAERS
jgi:hypothetical protein